MGLQIWLPLNGNIDNLGVKDVTTSQLGTISWDGGKLSSTSLHAGNGNQVVNGVSINSNLTDVLSQDYSVAVWVKPLGNHVHYNGTILSSGDWNKQRWAFGVNQTNTSVDVLCNGHNSYISCSVPVNEWTHLACTYKRSEGKVLLYKNGEYVSSLSTTATITSDATNTCVGRETYASGYFSFNGQIQDLRLYDCSLSAEMIKEISKGLSLHYTLSDEFTETSVNCLPSTRTYSINTNPAWDKTLNGEYMITPSGWFSGYNSGVSAPTTGYHMRWMYDGLGTQPKTDNLVTGIVAGGQTTVSNNQVTTSGQNSDTYFRLQLSTPLSVGKIYKISCTAENVASGKFWRFPIGGQSNTSLPFDIYNGYNEYVFIANSGCTGNPLMMDDLVRTDTWQNNCVFKNFDIREVSPSSQLIMHSANKNSVIGQTGRWMGISGNVNLANYGFTAGCKYTISWEQKTTNISLGALVGLYYKLTSSGSSNFHDGYPRKYNTQVNTWERITSTFTMSSSYDGTAPSASVYFYGYASAEGDLYIRNMQLEVKDHATAYQRPDVQRTNSVLHDVSGFKNNGTGNNLTLYKETNPKFRNSLVFNGSNSYVKVDNNNWMSQNCEELTYNIWAYSTNWSTYYNRIISCTECGGFNIEPGATGYVRFPVYVCTNESQTSFAYQYNNSGLKLADMTAGWHMITWVYTKSNQKVYLDGVLQSTNDTQSYGIHYNTNARLFLGCEASGSSPSSPYYNGRMSDFRIYHTALTEDEIVELYNHNRLG